MSTYRASHILVKHEESRRPSSWKDETGKDIMQRTKIDAEEQIQAFRAKIVAGEEAFEDIAKRESDCGTAAQGGDVGEFKEGELQQPFFEAVVGLQVGEMSGPVHTDSGCHLIKRTA